MPSIEITEFGSNGWSEGISGGAVAPDINVQLPSTNDINQRSKRLDDQKRMFTNNLKMLDALLLRKVGAEFLGTFILVFFAAGAPIVNEKYENPLGLIGGAASSGLAIMIVIMSVGHISGAHLNPAVTIVFTGLRHLPFLHVPAYIFAQVMASICASFILKAVFHPFHSGGITTPATGDGQAFVLELIASFCLMFVIISVATDTRAVGELAGIAVGGTIMLDILIAGPGSGGSMNPARTLGPAIAAHNYKGLWIYMVSPVIGAFLGGSAYKIIQLPGVKEDPSPQEIRRSFHR